MRNPFLLKGMDQILTQNPLSFYCNYPQLFSHLLYIQYMKPKKLAERVISVKAASDFEHKLIDSLYNIMAMKRKAQLDYRTSLQGILQELERFAIAGDGFLTELVRTYQSYISVLHQNQTNLIEGYDTEVLSFLAQAKQSKLEHEILKKVNFVDSKVQSSQEQIKHYKKLIRQNDEQLHLISGEAAFKGKINTLSVEDKSKLGERFNDLVNLKKINEEALEQHVDGMMDMTMLHNKTVEELNEYETTYLDQKANDVYDNFMHTFFLEASHVRSIQFDVTSILQRIYDKKDEHKRISLDNLRRRRNQERGIINNSGTKDSFWGSYKKWTSSEGGGVDINENCINPRIRDKWRRVCQYYNTAAL